MGFKKGTPKPEGSGRKKGTPNKVSEKILEKLERLDADLVYEILQDLRLLEDPRDRIDVRLKLMEFAYPKLRAIEETITANVSQLPQDKTKELEQSVENLVLRANQWKQSSPQS